MKVKFLGIAALAVAFAAGMTACGGNAEEQAENQNNEATENVAGTEAQGTPDVVVDETEMEVVEEPAETTEAEGTTEAAASVSDTDFNALMSQYESLMAQYKELAAAAKNKDLAAAAKLPEVLKQTQDLLAKIKGLAGNFSPAQLTKWNDIQKKFSDIAL